MIIWMYSEDHEPPHILIICDICDGKVSRIRLDVKIIENFLPSGKYKILKKWMRQNKDELYTSSELVFHRIWDRILQITSSLLREDRGEFINKSKSDPRFCEKPIYV